MSSFSSGFGRGLGWGLGSSMSRDLYRSATAPPRIALSPTAVERVESEVDGTYLLVSVWSTGRTTVHTTLHATAEGEWHLIDDGYVDREHALAAMRQVADYLRRGGTVRGILAMKADLKAAYAAIDTEQAADRDRRRKEVTEELSALYAPPWGGPR